MPIRLVAIDLDGTLLNSRREISEGNRRALLEAVEREVQVVIVTGRRFHSALPLVSQIPCPVTLITSNGALIADSWERFSIGISFPGMWRNRLWRWRAYTVPTPSPFFTRRAPAKSLCRTTPWMKGP